jgi:hypothetical protein
MHVGVVNADAHTESTQDIDDPNAWPMRSGNSSLCGNGSYLRTGGVIKPGQLVKVIANPDEGYLRFLVDGDEIGCGYLQGARGALRFEVVMYTEGNTVTIEDPEPRSQ